MRNVVLLGDVREKLKEIPDGVVQTCVTSPPYFGLRDYGHEGQIGLEPTPEAFVAELVEVFREVRRVLRDDGTLWLNLGDSYASNGCYINAWLEKDHNKDKQHLHTKNHTRYEDRKDFRGGEWGIKAKDLNGIPWRVAFALQADGWYLRQDIIWHKPNPMPESVEDRCTKAHEYIFLLTKSQRYFYDHEAVKVQASGATLDRNKYGFNTLFKGQFAGSPIDERYPNGKALEKPEFSIDGKANRRSVWTVPTKSYKGAHFATFPEEIPEVCIRAGTREGDLVLDPFSGSGTTLAVAKYLRRDYIGVELNPEYHKLIEERLQPALDLETERQGFDAMLDMEQE